VVGQTMILFAKSGQVRFASTGHQIYFLVETFMC
jgi:hypothetical protein